MATFPELDAGGTAYQIQLWSTMHGGIPVWVGVPGVPDIATPELETLIHAFAADLSTHLDASITQVSRFRTTSDELPTPPA